MKRITLYFGLEVDMSVPDNLTDDEMRQHVQTLRLALSDGVYHQQRQRGLVAEGATVHEVVLRHVQVDKR